MVNPWIGSVVYIRPQEFVMAFPVPIASALSGATPRQLAYWRRPTRKAEPLLVPKAKRSGRFIYSWADVVALRAIIYLRRRKSLPKIRGAVDKLRKLEADEWEHLSSYQLVRTGDSIIVKTPRGELLDLEHAPGAVLEEALLEDILAPFSTADGYEVPGLPAPRPHLAVHPQILGGYPVMAESRVPFDLVAGLADDGVAPAEIVAIYPTVAAEGVADAQSFAGQVAQLAA